MIHIIRVRGTDRMLLRFLPEATARWAAGCEWRRAMEKIVVMCVIITAIVFLAEMSPAPRPRM
jgi:hypothetical protein